MDQNKGDNQSRPETFTIPVGSFSLNCTQQKEEQMSCTLNTPSIQFGQSNSFNCNGYYGITEQSYGVQCRYRF